jgi:hypothetical protein
MSREAQRGARLAAAVQAARSASADLENELEITDVKAWALREPVSQRAYSVLKIQAKSGPAEEHSDEDETYRS